MDTYEKKYKDANDKVAARFGTNVAKEIFTDLYESEDEKIRKSLISYLQGLGEFDYPDKKTYNNWLAWLEKQGKETSWKPSKEEMDVLYGLAYITNQYDEHKEEVITRLYQDLKREFFNGSSYENMFPNTEDGVRRRSTIQVLEYARSLDTYNQYGKADIDKNIAWLEKQNKQKSQCMVSAEAKEAMYDKPTDLEVFINELSKQFPDVSFAKLSRIAVRVAKWAKPSDEEMKELLRTEYEKGRADAIAEMQKSAWSKDDEMIALSIEQVTNCASLLNIVPEKVDKIRTWLKSLKERCTWKPSEEQLDALKRIQTGVIQFSVLQSLYNDLKKL